MDHSVGQWCFYCRNRNLSCWTGERFSKGFKAQLLGALLWQVLLEGRNLSLFLHCVLAVRTFALWNLRSSCSLVKGLVPSRLILLIIKYFSIVCCIFETCSKNLPPLPVCREHLYLFVCIFLKGKINCSMHYIRKKHVDLICSSQIKKIYDFKNNKSKAYS